MNRSERETDSLNLFTIFRLNISWLLQLGTYGLGVLWYEKWSVGFGFNQDWSGGHVCGGVGVFWVVSVEDWSAVRLNAFPIAFQKLPDPMVSSWCNQLNCIPLGICVRIPWGSGTSGWEPILDCDKMNKPMHVICFVTYTLNCYLFFDLNMTLKDVITIEIKKIDLIY